MSHLSGPLSKVSFLALVGLFALELSGAVCRTTVDTPDGADAGSSTQPLNCESVDECPDPANYDCLGVCLQRCASDAVCKLSEFCSSSGYCEPGCRDSSTCDQGQVCVAGSCVDPGGAGACGTKCDCLPGQVCADGICTAPPATCSGPDDCGRGQGDRCEAYQCNGFTGQCFDPDPQPCTTADDCVGRPGCPGDSCVCTGDGQCVPGGACDVATETADCGAGFYCDDTLNCAVLPACTGNGDCPDGLICNLGTQQCTRPQPCSANTDCTTPPATYCNTSLSPARCDVPTCQNGGVTCGPTETCSQDGRCVPQGTGNACINDSDCPNDPWPNTQYCSYASGSGECTTGCRSNASCPAGQTCNGARQCVTQGGGGGGGQWGATCTSDADCQAGLICGVFTGTCAEQCPTAGGPCSGDPSCCPLSGAAWCNSLGFCSAF